MTDFQAPQPVPGTFPVAIWQLLLEVADRKGTQFTSPWEGPDGEPLQDDADAAIAWIKAAVQAPEGAPDRAVVMRQALEDAAAALDDAGKPVAAQEARAALAAQNATTPPGGSQAAEPGGSQARVVAPSPAEGDEPMEERPDYCAGFVAGQRYAEKHLLAAQPNTQPKGTTIDCADLKSRLDYVRERVTDHNARHQLDVVRSTLAYRGTAARLPAGERDEFRDWLSTSIYRDEKAAGPMWDAWQARAVQAPAPEQPKEGS